MTRSYSRSFVGGEVTPEFFGQIADAKYQTGLATCRNFRILPHGPAQNRAGFEFVREVKDSTKRVRLIPFEYSTTQTMVLEVGDGYVRFHTQGATLLSGATPYEVATSYAQADLFGLKYVQSADVLTLAHTLYPPAELRRLGALSWTLSDIAFTTTLAAPTGIAAVATFGATPGTPIAHDYNVTAVASNNIDESLVGAYAGCLNNLFDTGAYNTVTWTAVTGALRYNVYKRSNGLWAYIGQASGTTFKDDNITPDLAKTAPEVSNPFAAAGDYPGAVTYFEQRRCFAGTVNKPQNMWLTRSGTESNMSYSIPTRDADSITFRVVARQANTVRHLVPLAQLLALTSSAEWRVTSQNTDALTPTSISVKPQSYVGAADAQPVVVNNNVIYAAARGGHAREMAYNWQAGGYLTGDLSLRAPHLFDGFDIVDMAFSKAPYPIVWMVSSNGNLLGLTYVPEQQIGAWHWHDTDGAFESVCVVAEGAEDVLYAVVRRTINGVQKRYVERMRPRAFATQADCFFVDAGLTYSGAPTTAITGLGHLEGKTVSILADGAAHRQLVVVGGAITLDYPASKVQVGLPIVADLKTLPMALEIPGFGQGTRKNVNKVFLRVKDSSGIWSGPDFDNLVEAKIRTNEPYGTPPTLQTREVEVVNKAAWTDGAQVCLRQADPLPLTLVSLTLDVAVGG
jgi:hypothetical protein